MKLQDIISEWDKDSVIDRSNVSATAANIPILHNKYFKIFSAERYRMKTLEIELKTLKLAKTEFYTQGPDPETPKDWKMPPQGRILKSEAGNYVDIDPDIVKINMRIAAQYEKVDYLEHIIKMIISRNFQLKSIIDWEKFIQGA